MYLAGRPDMDKTGRVRVTSDAIFIGGGGEDHALPQWLLLKYANRHGLIAGATGTGKTVTLQIMAEAFSAAGVPVFLSDVKGDLAGLALPGSETAKTHEPFTSRAAAIGFEDFAYRGFPVTFWDLFGQQGHPIRTTVAEMGPLLLSRMMQLTDAQEGVLNVAFRAADEEGLPQRPRRPNARKRRKSFGSVNTRGPSAIPARGRPRRGPRPARHRRAAGSPRRSGTR